MKSTNSQMALIASMAPTQFYLSLSSPVWAQTHISMHCVCTLPPPNVPHCICWTVGGVCTKTANLSTAKLLFNSVVLTLGSKSMMDDLKDFYLGTPMPPKDYAYMCISISNRDHDPLQPTRTCEQWPHLCGDLMWDVWLTPGWKNCQHTATNFPCPTWLPSLHPDPQLLDAWHT